MAAVFVGEEEVWKCQKHPSRRRKNGVCATCLRERLLILCPNCAHLQPCSCLFNSNSSSSSSSSAGESSLRRSRSVAIPFLQFDQAHNHRLAKTPSFLAVFTRSNIKRSSEPAKANNVGGEEEEEQNSGSNHRIDDFARMITRSRSVSVETTRHGGASTAGKAKFWRFPLKILRS